MMMFLNIKHLNYIIQPKKVRQHYSLLGSKIEA